MKTIYDIQQYLKKFGMIIYIGDRVSDLELMESEIHELYHSQLIDIRDYQSLFYYYDMKFSYKRLKKTYLKMSSSLWNEYRC